MVIHHCLPFADERRSVKCLGSAADVSFPSPPLPHAPTFLLLFPQCPRALAPLGLKETETTATQAKYSFVFWTQEQRLSIKYGQLQNPCLNFIWKKMHSQLKIVCKRKFKVKQSMESTESQNICMRKESVQRLPYILTKLRIKYYSFSPRRKK